MAHRHALTLVVSNGPTMPRRRGGSWARIRVPPGTSRDQFDALLTQVAFLAAQDPAKFAALAVLVDHCVRRDGWTPQ
jgi:hypothetical protein